MIKKLSLILAAALISSTSSESFATNIDWTGLYRIEGYSIKNSELNDRGRQKDFGLQHLILRPKIIAADGLTIYGQFNVFNSGNFPNSQVGQVFGSGVNDQGATNQNFPNSNATAQNNKAEDIAVSQLYLTFNHEYGQLIAGRAPIHFGLGMYHNSGMELFDHFYDTRDMVGYKIVMGNLWLMPMIGKVQEGDLNQSDDVTDYMVQLQYDNPDTMVEMGAFYQSRQAGDQGTVDISTDADYFGSGATTKTADNQTIGLYAKKTAETWSLGVEIGFQSGDLGVRTANGNSVTLGGSGIALELDYMPEDSPSEFFLKAGYATGDDSDSEGSFEGFFFDRNYNVGFLLMNHTLGQADFFRTGINGGGPTGAGTTSASNDQVDVESISNVIYIAPGFKYGWNERWSSQFTVITGFLQEDGVQDQESQDLGYEVDLSLQFQPQEGIIWMTELGLLSPGAAFKGAESGSLNFESKFAYGLNMKAAISF